MAAKKAKKAPAKKKVVAKKKVAAKKAPKKAARKVPAKKAAPAAKKRGVIKDKMSKTQILQEISDNTEVAKKDVAAVLDELSNVIERHVQKKACGEFTLPGLLKIKTVKKPARKAKKGVPNPFKPGELMDIAAKPASIKVKALPLKRLKEMAE